MTFEPPTDLPRMSHAPRATLGPSYERAERGAWRV